MARTFKRHSTTPSTHHESFGMSRKSANFWAVLTILALPIGLLAATSAGATATVALLTGVAACFSVLVANAAADGRLWMFHPELRQHFDHPEFSYRLAILCGALLLMVQTIFLVFVLFGTTGNHSMLRLIYDRECRQNPYPRAEFCQSLTKTINTLPY